MSRQSGRSFTRSGVIGSWEPPAFRVPQSAGVWCSIRSDAPQREKLNSSAHDTDYAAACAASDQGGEMDGLAGLISLGVGEVDKGTVTFQPTG
jgi:hypothetical protein